MTGWHKGPMLALDFESCGVAWRIAETYPAVAQADVFDLHQEQIHWHQEQKDSLRAYFDGKGITHDGCDGRWPVQLPVLTEQRAAS